VGKPHKTEAKASLFGSRFTGTQIWKAIWGLFHFILGAKHGAPQSSDDCNLRKAPNQFELTHGKPS
jgi:hypothetical protein